MFNCYRVQWQSGLITVVFAPDEEMMLLEIDKIGDPYLTKIDQIDPQSLSLNCQIDSNSKRCILSLDPRDFIRIVKARSLRSFSAKELDKILKEIYPISKPTLH